MRRVVVAAALIAMVAGCGGGAAQVMPTAPTTAPAPEATTTPTSVASEPTAEPTVPVTAEPSAAVTPEPPTQEPTAEPTPTPKLKSIEDLIGAKQPKITAAKLKTVVAAAIAGNPKSQSDSGVDNIVPSTVECTKTSSRRSDRAYGCFWAIKLLYRIYRWTHDEATYQAALRVHAYFVHNLLPFDTRLKYVDRDLRDEF